MSAQQEFPSFKLLLKQVYTAHSSKVKELENEIKILKEKLNESERKTNISTSDCKRCIELEEAFKTCKKALSEQSKWFESFGQKFSIFNSSQFENQDFKDNSKSSNEQGTTSLSRNVKEETVKSVKIEQDNDDLQNYEKLEIKLSGAPNNQNLLNKVMFDGESFDAYTVTFNKNLQLDNLNMKSDSHILAPDTLNNISDDQKIHETGFKERFMRETEKSMKVLEKESTTLKESSEKESTTLKESSEKESTTLKESSEKESTKVKETKVAHKRLSSESLNEDRAKRCNKGIILQSSSENIINNKDINPDLSVRKIFEISELPNNPKISENKMNLITDLSSKNEKKIKNLSLLEAAKPSKENKTEIQKSSTLINNPVNDLKSLLNHTSPSLLPKPINVPSKIIDLESIPNDDDFQEQVPGTKPTSTEDVWDSSDRKKLLKKNKSVRQIKSTTKYKMTLDAPPLNYKKPNYKQTKLSKSIFQTMVSKANKKSLHTPTTSKNNLIFESEEEDDSLPTALPDNLQSSTPIDAVTSPTVVDIDATFIPENFKLVSPQFNTTNVKKNTVEKSNLKNGNLFCNISFPDEIKSTVKNKRHSVEEEDEIKDSQCSEEVELKENMNSFDRLPMPEEPKYKYKNDVVRKKAERKLLNGFGCKECEKYYSELGLSEKEKKERMKKCSRHRGKFSPPATPDHFWELDFPDTEECKARGYLKATQKVKLNNICDI